MDITDRFAVEWLNALEKGEVSAVELTKACLDRIESHDETIGAFLTVDAEGALAQAEAVDRKRKAGEKLGRLAGLPVAVKDVLCTKDLPTTCASRMLADFRPPYDADVIERLRRADAVIIGKTNMDEFAMGGSTENSAFKPTRNPWDTARIPGGSSGGAAACVAAGMVPLSVGSDTGGSIRQPAALCGVTGLKPTYGRVSRYGLVAFASSLDQIGPLARSVDDCALLLEVIAGHDPRDSTSVNRDVPAYTEAVGRSLDGLKLGVVREHFAEGLDPQVEAAVREAIEVYRSLGADVREISLPHSKYAVAAYYIIAPCEASSNLARYDGVHYGYRTDVKAVLDELAAERKACLERGDTTAAEEIDSALVRMYRKTRAEGFGPEVKRRIMLGTYALSAGYYDAYYLKASRVRRLIKNDFDAAFADVDLIVGPVTPGPAFKLGDKIDDPLAMYLFDLYTVGTNLAGLPGISVPCGFTSEGLPVGLHLQAPWFREDLLLQGAAMFQRETDWHTKLPSLG
ncbi:Asp-tRNA(Asn)/Glu-tRNA(Gln) amidotransferase subunit GatA [Thermostilla marina]